MTTEQFIKQFAGEDVRTLAFKAQKYPDVDVQYALNQISGRQKALKKLPAWAGVEGVVYPPHISMEQCSSEFTAIYKRNLLHRIAGEEFTLTDITGGFGVDFIYMSEDCCRAVYVERNSSLCNTMEHNIKVFGRTNAEIVNKDAEDFVPTMDSVDVVYADPARRDASGSRTYAVSDCTPDIIKLLPLLLDRSRFVVVKLSPMLDHNKTADDFNKVCRCVREVHVISASNECKELLMVLSRDASDDYELYCVNDDDVVSLRNSYCKIHAAISLNEDYQGMYLYEPNASVMKAGAFSYITENYDALLVARNSNLFVSREKIKNFPGRSFLVVNVTTMNKKEMSRAMSGIKKANITVRNFPASVAELRKRLKVSDGGDTYIFATTSVSGMHVLLICEKCKN